MSRDVEHVALRLRGGFGNQLFQFAAGRRVLLGSDGGQLMVLSYGNEWGTEHPDLASVAGVPVEYPHRWHRLRFPVLDARETWKDDVSHAVATGWAAATRTCVFVQRDPFEGYDLPSARRYALDGHFQHPDWWSQTWSSVAREVHLREPAPVAELRRRGTVAVKLRRSDYVGSGWVLPDDFYRTALDQLGVRDADVTVVCEENENLDDFADLLAEFGCRAVAPVSITGNRNYDDFWNLAAASTLVIANSSYCWWAAAVAQVADDAVRVAYPHPWLPNEWSDQPMPDMGLDGWLRVATEFR
jgi:hypothetical protein